MEKPILFNTEMVRAILDGRKTQTRRLIRPQPEGRLSYIFAGSHPGKWTYMSRSEAKAWDVDESVIHEEDGKFWTPPCKGGDVLYVRETWSELYYVDPDGYTHYDRKMYFYAADGEPDIELLDADGFLEEDQRIRWKPSIHMPKAAARIWLKVKRVRVERLQDITEEGVIAEGAEKLIYRCEHMDFSVVPPEPCYNTNTCKDCIIDNGYPELFGKMVWDKTINPKDLNLYGWDANPWVWVIEFERVEGKHDD